jgi:hypothetical protein
LQYIIDLHYLQDTLIPARGFLLPTPGGRLL